ncbi:putative nucleotidyltransferase [Caldalkalibacillus uzonensis]|uniref:Nucleotidyltransferase n=1 Tax=Caldalkalibacillus uzonensis TaxID=353224 RepID=A0ABU0CPY8_9BACI|nr:nucleotidyltransferase domain-containing protein [Caldalkalibacillus uzonensis]MDQ0338456.1 putative nucleotidyltransferase [Caldalkalibacillus uzonensis]
MTPLDISRNRHKILRIAREHGAIDIKLFGSVSKNQVKPDSDVDFLVEFEEGRTLFDLISMKDTLESLLGYKVHLVTQEGLLADS